MPNGGYASRFGHPRGYVGSVGRAYRPTESRVKIEEVEMPKYKGTMSWEVTPIDTAFDRQVCSRCENLCRPGVEATCWVSDVPHCDSCLDAFKAMIQRMADGE